MRFLIHSDSGDGAAIAWKLQNEGEEVYLYIDDKGFTDILKDMVPHVNSVEEGLSKKPDLILFDMSGHGKLADSLRKRGYAVAGGGSLNDLLELDRSHGMQTAEGLGVDLPPYERFSKVADAVKYIQETEGRFVLKPHDNAGLDLTYMSKGPEDMIAELERLESEGILKGDFILQEFVEGLEISTEMWFSKGVPLYPGNGTFEQKKFLAGNLGPNTGCESSVVWIYQDRKSPILQQTVKRLLPMLKEFEYSGPIDINAIIGEDDGIPYFLEFTPRFGYSALYGMAELLDEPLGKLLYEVATGRTKDIQYRNEMSLALTLSVSPYPLDSGKPHNRKGIELSAGKAVDIPEDKHFWPYDVKSADGKIVTAGCLGLVGYLTTSGKTPEELEKNIYAEMEDVHIPDLQYRIDAAKRAHEDLPRLYDLGFETPLKL